MVSSSPGLSIDDSHADYLYVDWGTSFADTHISDLIRSTCASVMLDTPGLAYRLLQERGGSAYLPRRLVADDLKQGYLHIVRGADVVPRPVYLIHSNAWSPTPAMAPVMHAIQSLDTARANG
jgi:DNA-binding transcriptional LysR family regulator